MGLGEPNDVSIISNADAALAAVSVNDVVIHFSDAPYHARRDYSGFFTFTSM